MNTEWPIAYFNPFTPKCDQFQISPAASPAILHHAVWRTFHSFSLLTQIERWLLDQLSLQYLTYTFLFKRLGECTFWHFYSIKGAQKHYTNSEMGLGKYIIRNACLCKYRNLQFLYWQPWCLNNFIVVDHSTFSWPWKERFDFQRKMQPRSQALSSHGGGGGREMKEPGNEVEENAQPHRHQGHQGSTTNGVTAL